MDNWDLLEQDRRDREQADAASRAKRGILSLGEAAGKLAEASSALADAAKAWADQPWRFAPHAEIRDLEKAIAAVKAAEAWEADLSR